MRKKSEMVRVPRVRWPVFGAGPKRFASDLHCTSRVSSIFERLVVMEKAK